ncbi:hypothetical protein Anapl_04227 [Anas platyrhynchos]|uniref:Uncharacterized protein n=1 Tax=Anas platyrhynchos TaxID=8839 RepID=R0L2Q1_ANAPL|nr:hypothetical protein Anapl_04227 [Anas platyrhynchos]
MGALRPAEETPHPDRTPAQAVLGAPGILPGWFYCRAQPNPAQGQQLALRANCCTAAARTAISARILVQGRERAGTGAAARGGGRVQTRSPASSLGFPRQFCAPIVVSRCRSASSSSLLTD